MYVYIYAYKYTYIYMHVYIYICTYLPFCVCMCERVLVCFYGYMHIDMLMYGFLGFGARKSADGLQGSGEDSENLEARALNPKPQTL